MSRGTAWHGIWHTTTLTAKLSYQASLYTYLLAGSASSDHAEGWGHVLQHSHTTYTSTRCLIQLTTMLIFFTVWLLLKRGWGVACTTTLTAKGISYYIINSTVHALLSSRLTRCLVIFGGGRACTTTCTHTLHIWPHLLLSRSCLMATTTLTRFIAHLITSATPLLEP